MDAFTPKTWQDNSGGGTPITAAELNRVELGIESADDRLDAAEPAIARTRSHVGGPARSGVYDPRLNLYLPVSGGAGPSAALRKLRSAVARAKTGLVNWAVLGASNTAGAIAGQQNAYATQLRALLAARGIPVAGTGLVPVANVQATSPMWTAKTGAWGDNALYSVAQASGISQTFVSDMPGTVVQVWYFDITAPFTVTIDGGAPQTVNPSGEGGQVRTASFSGLADTTHTVVITTTSADVFGLVGAGVRRASGLVLSNLGISGAMSSTFSTDAFTQPSQIAKTLSPDIVSINLGSNDMANSVSLAQYKSNMDALMALYPNAAFLLISDTYRDASPTWPQWMSALYDRADSYGVPLLDVTDRFGTTAEAVANGQLVPDQLHLNPAGQFQIARALADIVA